MQIACRLILSTWCVWQVVVDNLMLHAATHTDLAVHRFAASIWYDVWCSIHWQPDQPSDGASKRVVHIDWELRERGWGGGEFEHHSIPTNILKSIIIIIHIQYVYKISHSITNLPWKIQEWMYWYHICLCLHVSVRALVCLIVRSQTH